MGWADWLVVFLGGRRTDSVSAVSRTHTGHQHSRTASTDDVAPTRPAYLRFLPSLPARLFQYSPKRLLDEVPTMFAFPKLGDVFAAIAGRIAATVRTGGWHWQEAGGGGGTAAAARLRCSGAR